MTDAPPPSSPPYRDRRAGLIVFGILHIAMGVVCTLAVLGAAVASELAARRGAAAMPPTTLAYVIVVNSAVALYGFVAGVGSIRARRWARAIVLAVSGIWLAGGVASMISLAFMLPKMRVLVPPSQERMFITLQVVVGAVIYILLPLGFVLFYRQRDVALTVAAHDPRPRWTDRVPVSVLALVLLLAFSAVALLAMLSNPVVPLFGVIVTGGPAILILVALSGLMAWLALQIYRLRLSAWMTLLILQFLGGGAALVTFARMDVNRYYESLGVTTPQTRAMHLEQLFRDPWMLAVMAVFWVGYLAFVFSLRRYFTGAGPKTRAEDRRGATVAPASS
jgi:hypothetical protein